jgi:predicted acetyltransferase
MTGVDPLPRIHVTGASLEQKPLLSNLLELYMHDFSEFMDFEIGRDGRFGYRHLDLYWTDPRRFPFLIYVSGKLAGFFLVQRIPRADAVVWDMAEFFILRGYRRQSIGARAAHEAFTRFPGPWQVRVMKLNEPACAFWNHAVRAFAGEAMDVNRIRADGKEWNVYTFNSPPAG